MVNQFLVLFWQIAASWQCQFSSCGLSPRKKRGIIIIDLQAVQTRQVVKEPGGQLPNVIVLQETESVEGRLWVRRLLEGILN